MSCLCELISMNNTIGHLPSSTMTTITSSSERTCQKMHTLARSHVPHTNSLIGVARNKDVTVTDHFAGQRVVPVEEVQETAVARIPHANGGVQAGTSHSVAIEQEFVDTVGVHGEGAHTTARQSAPQQNRSVVAARHDQATDELDAPNRAAMTCVCVGGENTKRQRQYGHLHTHQLSFVFLTRVCRCDIPWNLCKQSPFSASHRRNVASRLPVTTNRFPSTAQLGISSVGAPHKCTPSVAAARCPATQRTVDWCPNKVAVHGQCAAPLCMDQTRAVRSQLPDTRSGGAVPPCGGGSTVKDQTPPM